MAATIAAGDRGVPGRAYNIGGGSRVSVNQVLEIIERLAGHPLDVAREGAQKGDVRDTYADTSLARADLGFAPRGVARTRSRSGVSMAFDNVRAGLMAARSCS